MKSFSSVATPSRYAAILTALSAASLCFSGACERSNQVVLFDDEPAAATQEAPALPETPVATPAPAPEVAPAVEAVPEPAPTPVVPPKFDEKGVSVDLTNSGVFNGFESAQDKARQNKLKVVRGSGPISVEGLRAFAAFPELVEFLWLDAQLPDGSEAQEAFKAFASAPKLKKLRLTGLKLESGAFPTYALSALASTPNLADLDISGSPASAEDLAAVDYKTGFAKLARLNLYQTNAGDAGVAAVLPLADRLTWLNFDDAKLTPAAASDLARFVNLTFLHVGRSALDDSCVDSLTKLTKLEKIHVTRSGVTEEGADKLRAALPGCTVVSQPEN